MWLKVRRCVLQEPSLAGGPPSVVAFAANAVAAPSPAVADHIRPSPVPCIPAAAVVADAPAVPAARFSSSVRPQHVQVMDTVEAYAHSNSERGSNAAVPRRLVATPQQRALILRDAEQPVCSDPGPGMWQRRPLCALLNFPHAYEQVLGAASFVLLWVACTVTEIVQ